VRDFSEEGHNGSNPRFTAICKQHGPVLGNIGSPLKNMSATDGMTSGH
jgi:hypothetical protein